MSVDKAVQAIQDFQGASLTENLSKIETEIVGIETDQAFQFCEQIGVDANFLNLALSIKSMASQINVIIHAAGILHSLKTLLDDGERVESVSLGAGNTGKSLTWKQISEWLNTSLLIGKVARKLSGKMAYLKISMSWPNTKPPRRNICMSWTQHTPYGS